MQAIKKAIDGNRTIISSIVLIIVSVAGYYGFDIDAQTQAFITTVLGAIIAIFLRLGMKKAERAARGQLRDDTGTYLSPVLLLLLFPVLLAGPAEAAEGSFVWEPPTHKVEGDDCTVDLEELTQEEIDSLVYSFSYRVKGTEEWTNEESQTTSITLEGLMFGTVYESVVSAHWPGYPPFCPSEINEFTVPIPIIPLPVIGLTEEAESGDLFGAFVIGYDNAASGGQYVHVPLESSMMEEVPNEEQRVDLDLEVTDPGIYQLKGNVYSTDGSDDSFYVKVNGQPEVGYKWFILNNTTYAEDLVNDKGSETDPVEIELQPGTHKVSIYLREAGARLDKLELVKVADIEEPVIPQPAAPTAIKLIMSDGTEILFEPVEP